MTGTPANDQLDVDESKADAGTTSPIRVAVDLDGTICELKRPGQSYADLAPLPGAIDRLRELRAAGCYIIIITARNMKTCEANLGRVMKNVGKVTLDWLEQHGVEFDEIYFGKANAHVYLDDRAHRFTGWAEITPELIGREAREQ